MASNQKQKLHYMPNYCIHSGQYYCHYNTQENLKAFRFAFSADNLPQVLCHYK